MKHEALSITANALAITSQLLAIGIEVGIVAGGYYIYKKLTDEPKIAEHTPVMNMEADAVLVPEGYELVPIKGKKEPTFKERWEKIGRIVKAVLEG